MCYAGVVDTLQDAAQGGWIKGEVGHERAAELLVALSIQRDNLE